MYNNASMHKEYQHVRCSIRNVRPEYYEVVDKSKRYFHVSQNQAEAAVVERAKKLFGRNWKYHDGDEIDVDTLPEKMNCRSGIEAMALNEIEKEVL